MAPVAGDAVAYFEVHDVSGVIYLPAGPGAHATAAGSPTCAVTGPDVRFGSSCVVMSRSFAMTACLDLDLNPVAGTPR